MDTGRNRPRRQEPLRASPIGHTADDGTTSAEPTTDDDAAARTAAPAWTGAAVLVSFVVVLLAQVLLVLGRLQDDGIALIYGSIGLSACAAVVLFIAVRRAKR